MLFILVEFLHNSSFYDFNQSATQEFVLGVIQELVSSSNVALK